MTPARDRVSPILWFCCIRRRWADRRGGITACQRRDAGSATAPGLEKEGSTFASVRSSAAWVDPARELEAPSPPNAWPVTRRCPIGGSCSPHEGACGARRYQGRSQWRRARNGRHPADSAAGVATILAGSGRCYGGPGLISLCQRASPSLVAQSDRLSANVLRKIGEVCGCPTISIHRRLWKIPVSTSVTYTYLADVQDRLLWR